MPSAPTAAVTRVVGAALGVALAAAGTISAGAVAWADPASAQPPAGTDFGPQVRAMFRVAACGGDDAIPARFPAKTINSHCQEMKDIYGRYRRASMGGA